MRGFWFDIYRPFCQTLPPALPAFPWEADPPFPLSPHLTGPPLSSTLHALENKNHYSSVIIHSTFHTLWQYAVRVDAFHELRHEIFFFFPSCLWKGPHYVYIMKTQSLFVLHTVVRCWQYLWWLRSGMLSWGKSMAHQSLCTLDWCTGSQQLAQTGTDSLYKSKVSSHFTCWL